MTFRPLPSPQAMPGTTSTRDGSDWRDRAACLDEDPELFFAIGSTAPGAQLQIALAKSVCHRCEVISDCLRWALDNGADDGVWGGLSEDERRALKRRVRRRNTKTATDPQKTPDKAPKKTFTDPVTRAICGTGAGYRRHTDLNESKCEPCAEWRRTRAQDRPCGTGAGYRAHGARKEAACDPCKAAKAAESVEYRRQKRTNAA